jgi:DNA-binding NarL/FixJ family response regulator
MNTIEQILPLVQDRSPDEILKVIEKYYLTKRERRYLAAYKLYLGGKTQRELGMALAVAQTRVSVTFSRVVSKVQKIANLLTNFTMDDLMVIKQQLTGRQYEILCFLLVCNRQYWIAKHLKVKPPTIFQICRNFQKRLTNPVVLTFLKQIPLI